MCRRREPDDHGASVRITEAWDRLFIAVLRPLTRIDTPPRGKTRPDPPPVRGRSARESSFNPRRIQEVTPHPVLVHAALVLVAVIYGLNYVFIKILLEEVPTTRAWVFLRIASATLIILPIAWLSRRPAPPVDTRWYLVLAAFLGVVLNQVLFAEGLARTTPAHSSVINCSIPVLTLCIAALVHQERFTIRKVIAVGVALTGVLILLEADRMLLEGRSLQETMVGDLLTLGNATAFSVFLVLMRSLGNRVDPLMATAFCFVVGTVFIGAYGAPAVDAENVRALVSPRVLPLAIWRYDPDTNRSERIRIRLPGVVTCR